MDILIVQLKRSELILAGFRPKKGGVSFLSAERHQLSGDEGEIARILAGSTLARGEHRVALALPPNLLFMRELEMPIKDRAKVRELLPLELKGETALDTDALVFDALPLADGKFLAVWGQTQPLARQIEILKGAGLEPELVTSSLFHWNKLAPPAGTVVVTDGEALAAYYDNKAIYFRALPSGTGEVEQTRTVAALELAQGVQVGQVISYAQGSQESLPPTQATRALAEAFGDDAHAAHDLSGAWAVAAAMADGTAINLRRGALAYTAGQAKLLRKLRPTMVLAAAAVLLFFAESGVRYYLVKRDLGSLDSSVNGIYKEIFPARKKPVDPVSEVRSEIKRLEGTRTSSNLLKLLKDLANAKGDDVSAIFETEVDGTDIRLKGDAKNIQAANDFKGRVAPLVDAAEVSEIKSRPDNSVTFTLHAKMKGVTR